MTSNEHEEQGIRCAIVKTGRLNMSKYEFVLSITWRRVKKPPINWPTYHLELRHLRNEEDTSYVPTSQTMTRYNTKGSKKVPVGPTCMRYRTQVRIEEVNVVTKRGSRYWQLHRNIDPKPHWRGQILHLVAAFRYHFCYLMANIGSKKSSQG